MRLDKTGESGILVVYKSIRRIPPFQTAKAELAQRILFDAIGRDDILVELKGGEDWIARNEAIDSISKSSRI